MDMLYTLEIYLDLSPDKNTFKSNFNINLVKANELIREDQEHNTDMEFFLEIILVITTICPAKDAFLDKVGEMNEDLIAWYLNIIDEYILSGDEFVSRSSNKVATLKMSQLTKNMHLIEKDKPEHKLSLLESEKEN